MADDKHYVPGDFYRLDDRTGFKVRAGKTRKEWTGMIVREQSWEPRQPQDFVRGRMDDQNVPEPRPRQTDTFIGPLGTTLTANYVAGDDTFSVVSSVRMLVGDSVSVMQDNGENLNTTIISVPTVTSFQVANRLRFKASSGNIVIDKSAYSSPSIG